MALSHAVYLHNHTPNQQLGLAPVEVWTQSKASKEALLNMHTWRCPVYVLEPRLCDGQKIPKWEPRSKRGQYMGVSPMHATTVGLVRNPQTGSITPQYHAVYDDFFETVYASDDEEPKEWPDLVVMNSFRSLIDDDADVELSDEWLDPQALKERQLQREQQKAAGMPQAPAKSSDLPHGSEPPPAQEQPQAPAPMPAPPPQREQATPPATREG